MTSSLLIRSYRTVSTRLNSETDYYNIKRFQRLLRCLSTTKDISVFSRRQECIFLVKLASLRSRRRQYPSDDPYNTSSSTTSVPGPNSSPPSRSYSVPLFSRVQTAGSSSVPSFPPSSGPAQPEIVTMTYRDRTAEFSSVVRSLQPFQVFKYEYHTSSDKLAALLLYMRTCRMCTRII